MLLRINNNNNKIVQEKIIIEFLTDIRIYKNMFLFRKRQQVRSNISSIEEKQNLLTIEKETEVYIKDESEDISKKIYQNLMEAKNK